MSAICDSLLRLNPAQTFLIFNIQYDFLKQEDYKYTFTPAPLSLLWIL